MKSYPQFMAKKGRIKKVINEIIHIIHNLGSEKGRFT